MVARLDLDDTWPICVGLSWSPVFTATQTTAPTSPPVDVTGWTGTLTLFRNLAATSPETVALPLTVIDGPHGKFGFTANTSQTGGLTASTTYIHRLVVNGKLTWTGSVTAVQCT